MNYVERMGEWAKQNPDRILGWAAMAWEGPADLRDHQTSMHMTPLVSVELVLQLEAELAELRNTSKQAAGEAVACDKYDDVLRPFLSLMRKELHANAGKGDRPGWLQMDRKTALLELYYHLSKLQKAMKDDNADAIREYGADVANMAMMAVDVCGQLDVDTTPPRHPADEGVQWPNTPASECVVCPECRTAFEP